jgi:hypothetical protein
MKKEQAKRAINLMMGWGANPDVLDRAAEAIADERDNVMSVPELKSRLQSLLARCANAGIKNLGEFIKSNEQKL